MYTNARNSARCTQARKTTHGLDGQHQDVDVTEINGESTSIVWPTLESKMAKERNRCSVHISVIKCNDKS